MASFEAYYPIVMYVRWGGMTVEEAFRRLRHDISSADEGSSNLRTLMGDVLDAIRRNDEDETDASDSDESSEGKEK